MAAMIRSNALHIIISLFADDASSDVLYYTIV